MDIRVRKETVLGENRSWLGSAHGTQATRAITLDVTTFDPATHYPEGQIKSGTVLGRITGSKLYGPYDPDATDGREAAAGHLFNSTAVNAGATRLGAPLFEHGAVIESRLPANHGLDAAAKTDLSGRIIYR